MKLAVELYDTVIGHLEGGDSRSFDFHADGGAHERFGANSRVLSVAIPLTVSLTRQNSARRRNWFSELLPEGDQLDYLLTQGGIRRGDVPGFLARYGRDVAGALQIWDTRDPTEPKTPEARAVDALDIRRLLEDPVGAPLGNATELGRTSLGGIQPKIVLASLEGHWNQVLGGYPSTHILKPWLSPHPTVIYDEEYGARLARRLALADYDSRVEDFAGLPALVIERFDRAEGRRVHQEDFNQALGAGGNQKYQELGGVVSLARIADTLMRHATTADLRRLARLTVFATGIGNLDMHAKNLGLLHHRDGTVTLAPAYDQVPLAHLPGVDGRMALAVDHTYRHADITTEHLVAEFTRWGVRRAAGVVSETLEELALALTEEAPLPQAHVDLHDAVRGFVDNLQAGRPARD